MSNDVKCPSCGVVMVFDKGNTPGCYRVACDVGLINYCENVDEKCLLNTNFIMATGNKEPFKPGVGERRFFAVDLPGTKLPEVDWDQESVDIERANFGTLKASTQEIHCPNCGKPLAWKCLGKPRCMNPECISSTPDNCTRDGLPLVYGYNPNSVQKAASKVHFVVRTREEAVERIHKGLNNDLDLGNTLWHYGKVELRDLMDFIYGEKPQNEKQEIKDQTP